MHLPLERSWDENHCLPILKSITEIMKTFKSLYGFGGRCLKIRDVCMDFEPCFKVHNLVSVHPKSITLGQMINLDMIFHVVVSVYRLVKIWNSPQFPVEFRNGRPIHIINPVDKVKLSCNTPHRRSTTVSLEAYPLYSLRFFCLVSFVLQIDYRLTFFFTVQTLQSLL